MSLELLKPISNSLIDEIDKVQLQGSIIKNITYHSESYGLPNIDEASILILGVTEIRNSSFNSHSQDLNIFRKEFYQLKYGDWKHKIADIGDLPNGETVEDTYHAIYEICNEVVTNNKILIIIGGSNDLIFPIFKSFNSLKNKVNIVSIDNQFDLYQDSDIVSGRSYMNKIIIDESNKLNDFTNIGYQRHLCSTDEIELMEKLFFEYISLGEISENNNKAEPFIRDANIVGFDVKSLSFNSNVSSDISYPNGINPRLACILAKYAGSSFKTQFFGLFELLETKISNKLYAEIIWYFIDGVRNRTNEINFNDSNKFYKYIVQTSGNDLVFFKSKITNRWWMEIKSIDKKVSKYIPCLEEDYQASLGDNLPKRWIIASKRN
ncbi:MAG: arginase family protein [Bacteroidota bacterium]